MNIFKKIFKKLSKKKRNVIKEAPENNQECWYNNSHESGEAVRKFVSPDVKGSSDSFECHITQSNAMH